MALCERFAPRRSLAVGRGLRWASNLALAAINTVVVRSVVALGAVGIALVAADRGWGLFNNVALPGWLAAILAFVLLDLAIYLQHVMFHAVPVLWRLHRVHHADLDVDVTTGLRFHTLEILLSLGIKAAAILLLGPPAVAVLAFEIALNATSLFNHSNLALPRWLDRVLRLAVVTPDMHRIHHSVLPEETNSNYGFNLPWWDFLLGTYRRDPARGHERMTLGLAEVRDERDADRLAAMLLMPFASDERSSSTSGHSRAAGVANAPTPAVRKGA
jgi:sterol desaturase/sphingolipid hydroxylase (fatty acid hydroxylase superfamily)